MSKTGAQVIVTELENQGIRWVFGIPGTHNIELYDAVERSNSIQSVLVTHELSAAFMADGVARATGELAVLNVVPGAGLTHALSGIAESYLDQVPMLVLLSGVRSDTGASYQLHEIDQIAVVKPLAKQVFCPKNVFELGMSVRSACQEARSAPQGPTVVVIPANLFLERDSRVDPAGTALCIRELTSKVSDLDLDLESICKALNEARSIAIYVGQGARECGDLLPELANKLDAMVYTTISGKGIFSEKSPRWAWNTMGRSSPHWIRKIEADVDCVLAIGCRFGEVATGSYGFKQPKFLIHVDIDPQVFDRNYKADLKSVSDAKNFVERVLSSGLLRTRSCDLGRLEILRDAHRNVFDIQKQSERRPGVVSPSVLFRALQHTFGEETQFVTDSGRGGLLAMEHLRVTKPRAFFGPTDYSAMGYSVPAAIGAKLASPSRPVVAITGDGAFLMTGLELLTAKERGIGIVVCLLRDGELGQISRFQNAALGRKTCVELPKYPAERIAAGMGICCLRLSNDNEALATMRHAKELSEGGNPMLIEVMLDPGCDTFFSRGVVESNFLRFSWPDRLRLASRKIARAITNLQP